MTERGDYAELQAVPSELLCELLGLEPIVLRVLGECLEGPAVEHPARDLFEQQQPAGSEHPGDLSDGLRSVRYVVNDPEVGHGVEAPVPMGEGAGVPFGDLDLPFAGGQSTSGIVDHVRIEVDRGDVAGVQPVEKHLPDYEVELTIVIGKPAKNVSEAEALDYVLAYTGGNDVSIHPPACDTPSYGVL